MSLSPLRATAAAQAQAPSAEPPSELPAAQPRRLDVNMASVQELQTLPGIGRVLASRIVEFRQQHGPFKDARDLLKVDGIGEGKLEAIEDLIDVRTPNSN